MIRPVYSSLIQPKSIQCYEQSSKFLAYIIYFSYFCYKLINSSF